jgi:hypothetical protein
MIEFDDDEVSVFPTEKFTTLDGGGEDSAAYVLLYKSKGLRRWIQGLVRCVVRRILLNMFLPAAHDFFSIEVDLEHCYNIHIVK